MAEEISVVPVADMGSRAEQGGPSGVGAQGPSHSEHHIPPSTQMVGALNSTNPRTRRSKLPAPPAPVSPVGRGLSAPPICGPSGRGLAAPPAPVGSDGQGS